MAERFDIVSIGEPMLEFNQTRQGGQNYLQGFGGDTSNAMIAAARQGAKTAYYTRLGDDEFGRMCLDLWRREGVDASTVQRDASAPTGIYFVTHGEGGHSFSYRRAGSAASFMRPSDLPVALIRDAKILHVSGISQAISLTAADTVQEAIRIARRSGVKVSYDPNLRLKLWSLERAEEVIAATLASVDCFLPSLDDVRAVCGGLDEPHAIIDWCHAMGATAVVLKLGAAGSMASDGRVRTLIEPFLVDSVDATGAGDCFDGSLLARLAAGDPLADAARYASAAAALSTTAYGAVAPLPNAEQTRALL